MKIIFSLMKISLGGGIYKLSPNVKLLCEGRAFEILNLNKLLKMNNEKKVEFTLSSPAIAKQMLCAVCQSSNKVEYLTITNCNLCMKCEGQLREGFQISMCRDRSEDAEI